MNALLFDSVHQPARQESFPQLTWLPCLKNPYSRLKPGSHRLLYANLGISAARSSSETLALDRNTPSIVLRSIGLTPRDGRESKRPI